MKKISLTFFLVLFALPALFSVPKDEDVTNFYDGEFFLAEEEYKDALMAFKKVYNAGHKDNANLNYRIGICYLNLPGEKAESIPYLEKASENITDNYREGSFNETMAPIDVYLFLGNAYRIDYQLDKAIAAYNKYISYQEKKGVTELQYANTQINACKRAKLAIKNPANINTENIGEPHNNGFNNYKIVEALNGNGVAYMSEQRFYEAVFYAKKTNQGITDAVNITPQIQSDGDQFVTALSFQGDQLLLAKISSFDSDIMLSKLEDGKWSQSENLGTPVNTKYFESHASFSPDGKTIYFTSNRKSSIGNMDIYSSTLQRSGEWSEPKNLGATINTELNEESPFVNKSGKVLFFSSQGHNSIGGYDIFYSIKDDRGHWSEPKGLPYPINTTDDDLFFFPTGEDNEPAKGYMTSILPEGYGSGDIYEIDLIEEKHEEEVAVNNPAEKQELSEDTKKGEPGHSPETETHAEVKTATLSYSISPLFFKFDSFELTETAKEKLLPVAEVLINFEALKLEIHGHTDALGSIEYNQKLSENRAESVKKYLKDQGIAEQRLITQGFSENKPAAINHTNGKDSINGRKLNRRVEFVVLPKLPENIKIEEVEVPENLRIK